eukprot:CAMPEP_0185026730 /NCGR_PEP_ID=MMETSP1103-20130426/11060_1 /TAXON_ID=36769 /ORGANISM="Paraphysomonas bandaiensis, Strain Caron Lab Isolate" /LENGTH=222 /DNA_ID=CAMNT_0027560403 /DNA_START=150 /DNA_END=818 /DNA_ORIENTATION=+
MLVQKSRDAISSHGKFSVALSGGSMPKLLSGLADRNDVDWAAWHVYFADERCVPLDDDDSNFKACNSSFLSKVPIPESNIFVIDGFESPDDAASNYETKLRNLYPDASLDLVLLGLGPDGHTASLFPDHELLRYDGERAVVPIFDSPKPPSRRITLTLATINKSKEVMFIATGSSKAGVLRRIIQENDFALPATHVRPVSGKLTWILDREAAAELTASSQEL